MDHVRVRLHHIYTKLKCVPQIAEDASLYALLDVKMFLPVEKRACDVERTEARITQPPLAATSRESILSIGQIYNPQLFSGRIYLDWRVGAFAQVHRTALHTKSQALTTPWLAYLLRHRRSIRIRR